MLDDENFPPMTVDEAEELSFRLSYTLMKHPIQGQIPHIGFRDRERIASGTLVHLGIGIERGAPEHGLRRALEDFCHGYLAGFRVRDILFYICTRSLNYRKDPKYMKRWRKKYQG